MSMNSVRNNKISLCLGGGFAYGFAHAGVLKALYENNIRISELSACSMGAIIGATYLSFNMDGQRLYEFLLNMNVFELIRLGDLNFIHDSYFKGKRLKIFLHKIFKDKKIGDLPIPVKIIAAEPETNKLVIFDENTKLIDAVMASSAIVPFLPYYNGYYDGGFNTIVPAEILNKNNFRIVVNPYHLINYSDAPLWFDDSSYFSVLKQFQRTKKESEYSDLYIGFDFKNRTIFDLYKFKYFIQEGYNQSIDKIRKIKL